MNIYSNTVVHRVVICTSAGLINQFYSPCFKLNLRKWKYECGSQPVSLKKCGAY